MLWPNELFPLESEKARLAAEDAWKFLNPSISGQRSRGAYEPLILLSLAKAWKHDPEKKKLVQEALAWEAEIPATDTGHFGEIWNTREGEVYAGEAQPQLWHHALFYMAALEAFGEEKK